MRKTIFILILNSRCDNTGMGSVYVPEPAPDTGTRHVDCFRGHDTANILFPKFLVTPDFPGPYTKPISCKWT